MQKRALLLHGMTSSSGVFDDLVLQLRAKDFFCFAPELPGDRNHPVISRNSVRLCNYLSELAEYVQYVSDGGRSKITVIGQSFGALLAIKSAILYPELVERLVLLSVPLSFRHPKTKFVTSVAGALPYSITSRMPGIPKAYAASSHQKSNDAYPISYLKCLSNLRSDILINLSQLKNEVLVFQNINDYHLTDNSLGMIKNLASSAKVDICSENYGELHSISTLSEVVQKIVSKVS